MTTQIKENYYLQVITILKYMGTPANLKGYAYLRDAILYAFHDISLLDNMMNQLYKAIGEKHNTAAACVERDIRTAIEVTMNRGDVNYIYALFGNTIQKEKGKPTNREFIAAIVDLLQAISK